MGKIKVNKKKPPLSLTDKIIYYSILACTFPFLFLWHYFLQYAIPHFIELSMNPSYVATKGTFILYIPIIILVIVAFSFACECVRTKQPLFGNKNYKPKGLKPLCPVYPLLSKSYKENLPPKKRKHLRLKLIILIPILFICLLLVFFGTFPRQTLDSNDNFCSYNSFNLQTDCTHISKAKRMTVETDRIDTGGRATSYKYYLQITIDFEDRSYTFLDRDFQERSDKAILEKMIYLKSFFDDDCFFVQDLSYADNLFKENNYTAAEKALFYELVGEKS